MDNQSIIDSLVGASFLNEKNKELKCLSYAPKHPLQNESGVFPHDDESESIGWFKLKFIWQTDEHAQWWRYDMVQKHLTIMAETPEVTP